MDQAVVSIWCCDHNTIWGGVVAVGIAILAIITVFVIMMVLFVATNKIFPWLTRKFDL